MAMPHPKTTRSTPPMRMVTGHAMMMKGRVIDRMTSFLDFFGVRRRVKA